MDWILYIISIVITCLVTWIYASRRKLLFAIPSVFRLIDVGRLTNKQIKLLYGDKEIQSIHIVRMVLSNIGNHDIAKNAIHTAPRFDFGPDAHILDAKVLNTSEYTNGITTIVDNHILQFDIDFLQRKQSIAYQILLELKTDAEIDLSRAALVPGVIENTGVVFKHIHLGLLWKFRRYVVRDPYKVKAYIDYVACSCSLLICFFGLAVILGNYSDMLLFKQLHNFLLQTPAPADCRKYTAILGGVYLITGMSMFLFVSSSIRESKYLALFKPAYRE